MRQYGDFQTPPELVREILRVLSPIGKNWKRILEPTCGHGSFIRELVCIENPPKEIKGIEIQDSYVRQAKEIASTEKTDIEIVQGSIFDLDFQKDLTWKSSDPLLVIGNPPWVTNSEIGSLDGNNLPRKCNFKKLRGIDAITGRSNFDIAEYIWIKLLSELEDRTAAIALLCKTSVARNVLRYASDSHLNISQATIHAIDAKKWFGAAVDACLFTLKTGSRKSNYEADVFCSLDAETSDRTIGFAGGHFVSDINAYRAVSHIEGSCPLEWRQGIKHDASKVMELTLRQDGWTNGFGEKVTVEDDFIFPLIKGSDVQSFSGTDSIVRRVIVPQRRVNQDTNLLKTLAPELWSYLCRYTEIFQARKSSIYNNKAPFSIFGIGDYSFAPFKVIVSGLYKEPRFIFADSLEGKPVMCDDTCYLLPCDSAVQAAAIAAILNHRQSIQFLKSISFQDSKRPMTKAVLKRIDIEKLAGTIPVEDVRDEIVSSLTNGQTERFIENEIPSDLIGALNIERRHEQEVMFGI